MSVSTFLQDILYTAICQGFTVSDNNLSVIVYNIHAGDLSNSMDAAIILNIDLIATHFATAGLVVISTRYTQYTTLRDQIKKSSFSEHIQLESASRARMR